MATAVAPVNVRALRNEADWLPYTLEEAGEVRRVLTEAGVSDQRVNAIVGWLVAKVMGQEDRSESGTRSTYRKVLAELQSPLPPNRGGNAIPRLLNSVMEAA